MSVLPFRPVGAGRQMDLLTALMRHVAILDKPKLFGEVFDDVWTSLGLTERQAALDTYGACTFAIERGLIACSTHEAARGVTLYGEDCELSPTPILRLYADGRYMMDGPVDGASDGGAA